MEQVGPKNLLDSGMTEDVGLLAVGSDGMLYMPSFHNPEGRYEGSNFCSFYACMDYDFSSDVVYKIDPSNGTVTKFIYHAHLGTLSDDLRPILKFIHDQTQNRTNDDTDFNDYGRPL